MGLSGISIALMTFVATSNGGEFSGGWFATPRRAHFSTRRETTAIDTTPARSQILLLTRARVGVVGPAGIRSVASLGYAGLPVPDSRGGDTS